MPELSDSLRDAMRLWVAGVAIVASGQDGFKHGMTVNSFTSVSLDPPVVSVTLAKTTRTCELVQKSRHFSVTILSEAQREIADLFAGRIPDHLDRFAGLEVVELIPGVPALQNGLAALACEVLAEHELEHSILFLGRVLACQRETVGRPLIYTNRAYHRMAE